MAQHPVRKRATYEDVLRAPENMTAEILDGELHLMPRPRRSHLRAASGLGSFLFGAYQVGSGGPGGWTIIYEPDFISAPSPTSSSPISAAGARDGSSTPKTWTSRSSPSCPTGYVRILSPGTARVDRMKKVPIYARERVGHVWLVDPHEKAVEVLRLDGASYRLVGTFGGDGGVCAEPFDAAEIPPAFLWGKTDKP